MRGTLVCGLTDGEDTVGTVELAVELTQRLGMRLVLAHVAEGLAPIANGVDFEESVTMKGDRVGAERLLDRLAAEHGVAETAQRRVAVGQPATLLSQIAAEEAADLIGRFAGARLAASRAGEPACRPAGSRDARTDTDCPSAYPTWAEIGRPEWSRALTSGSMEARTVSLFWRIFAVNAGLLGLIAVLLVVTPVTLHAPPTLAEVLIIVAGLAVTVAANAVLLRRVLSPLGHLARRMQTVDLLRPGQRLHVDRNDEVGRVVSAFNQMLERLESERRRSARRVLAAQEAERVGIARDLHDVVGQLLTGVLLQLNSVAEVVPELRGEIDEPKEAVRRALDEVRRISSELRPEMLEHLGLVSALTELTTTFARVSGIQVERDLDPSVPKLEPETELAVYRIAQESLTNVARHSNAGRVTVALDGDVDSVVLRVVDDGRGFEGGMPQEHGGLRSMRERALLVDGALAVRESSGGGVEVRLEVSAARTVEAVGVKS